MTVNVNNPSIIDAVDDDFSATPFSVAGGTTASVFTNDTLNGQPFTSLPTIIAGSWLFNGLPNMNTSAVMLFTFNTAGQMIVPPNLQTGTYTVNYRLCQGGNSFNCDNAAVTIVVQPVLELLVTSTYQDANADGATNVGDTILYNFSVKNNGTSVMNNVNIVQSNLTIIGAPIAILAAGAINSNAFSALHTITQADINANKVTKSATASAAYLGQTVSNSKTQVHQLQLSRGFRLNAFLDSNANGFQDSNEANFSQGNFNIQLNGVALSTVASSSGIYFVYESNPANAYGFSFSSTNQYSAYFTSANVFSNMTVATSTGVVTLNFPIIAQPFSDVAVALIPNGLPPRPGFNYSNIIKITNFGTTVATGTITFVKNNAVSITSTSPLTTSNASGFTYNFTNLAPMQSVSITVVIQIPTIPTVSLGDVFVNSASITTTMTEVFFINNTASLSQIVVGSFDPNDKMEARGDKILFSTFTNNDFLTYTIRFENTGTFQAENVRVIDVLDNKLDETTIRMVDCSHTYHLIRSGKNLIWRFDGIDLPPSVANTNIGHGYITFQIKPKPAYAIGTVIPNFAAIYFDFNPPIITNTFTSTFVQALNIQTFGSSNFMVYPNPSSSILNITSKGFLMDIRSIEIFDVAGKNVLSANHNSNQIDVQKLQNGIYLLKINTNNASETLRFIKN